MSMLKLNADHDIRRRYDDDSLLWSFRGPAAPMGTCLVRFPRKSCLRLNYLYSNSESAVQQPASILLGLTSTFSITFFSWSDSMGYVYPCPYFLGEATVFGGGWRGRWESLKKKWFFIFIHRCTVFIHRTFWVSHESRSIARFLVRVLLSSETLSHGEVSESLL